MPQSVRRLRTPAATAAATLILGVLTGCSGADQVPSIGYGIDNLVTTYNGNTTEGSVSAAAVAFPRVLTGFFYTGPDGQPVADTDYGTAKEVPGETLTVQYRLNPDGVYSDGVPTSCDDLVLEWAARSGRFTADGKPLFDASNTAGYADIDRVECQPGSKDATVVFRPGRHYQDWKTLFGAGELMPAHVAAKAAGASDVVGPVSSGDSGVLRKIADFWNTGWKLAPGKVDSAVLPSSGPYRIDSFDAEDGLVLVANDRWWGNKPATGRIVLWPKNTDLKAKVGQKAVQVVDIGAGSVEGLDLTGFTAKNLPSRNTEQLILATTAGVFDNVDSRRTFAQCLPRETLYAKFGHPGYTPKTGLGSGVLNSRTVSQDALIYPAVSAGGHKYYNGENHPGGSELTVRLGYLGPDARRAKLVAAMAEACKPAGITITDAAAPDFDPRALRDGKVDAVLAGTAGALGTGGTLDRVESRSSLRPISGTDFGSYNNGRYSALVDQYAVADTDRGQLAAAVEAENILWNDLPSLPLYDQPRTIAFADGLKNTVPNPNKTGAGWNMDRWVLQR